MKTSSALLRAGLVAIAGLSLAACSSNHDDLLEYIDTVKARKGDRIDPLPDILPPPSFTYEPGNRRSPFVADRPQRENVPGSVAGPDLDRPREPLEEYPLDSLRMVGTFDSPNRYGLVLDPNGKVTRVTVGNYIGQNYGRIVAITDTEIQVLELISDGAGGYLERPASIALSVAAAQR